MEWQELNAEIGKSWYKKSLKYQMAGILDGLKDQGEEIWGKGVSMPSNVMMHVDTENSHIGVFGDENDTKGRPTHQWDLYKNSGLIVKTTRAKDGSEVHVTEQQIDSEALKTPSAPEINQFVQN